MCRVARLGAAKAITRGFELVKDRAACAFGALRQRAWRLFRRMLEGIRDGCPTSTTVRFTASSKWACSLVVNQLAVSRGPSEYIAPAVPHIGIIAASSTSAQPYDTSCSSTCYDTSNDGVVLAVIVMGVRRLASVGAVYGLRKVISRVGPNPLSPG